MKFWLIKRKAQAGYDEWQAHVILAENPEEARKIAAYNAGDYAENQDEWLDARLSKCTRLLVKNFNGGIIVSDFNAG